MFFLFQDTTEIENVKVNITEINAQSDENIETPPENIENKQIDTNETENLKTKITDNEHHDHTNGILEHEKGKNSDPEVVSEKDEINDTVESVHEKDIVSDKEDNTETVDEQKHDTNDKEKQGGGKEVREENEVNITIDNITDSVNNETDKTKVKENDNLQEVPEITSQKISNAEVENENSYNNSQTYKETDNFDDRPKSAVKKENSKEEEVSKTTPNEGNAEDDDDVQVQGNSHPEHNDIHTKSATLRQSNGSPRRGDTNTSSGSSHEL